MQEGEKMSTITMIGNVVTVNVKTAANDGKRYDSKITIDYTGASDAQIKQWATRSLVIDLRNKAKSREQSPEFIKKTFGDAKFLATEIGAMKSAAVVMSEETAFIDKQTRMYVAKGMTIIESLKAAVADYEKELNAKADVEEALQNELEAGEETK